VAYKERRYAFAEGERTHDGTYGLTPEMRERYADVTAVAAQPLYDRDGKVIGVLSLSSRSAATKLTTDLGLNEQVALAEQVSVTLVDLLRVTA
jgi:DNA-binding IclR family transcriptional regulator